MKKRTTTHNRLRLQKETIRNLVRNELQRVEGGLGPSCGAASACDCSGDGGLKTWVHSIMQR